MCKHTTVIQLDADRWVCEDCGADAADFIHSSKLDTARLALRDIMSRANPQEWHFQRAHEALKEVGFPT